VRVRLPTERLLLPRVEATVEIEIHPARGEILIGRTEASQDLLRRSPPVKRVADLEIIRAEIAADTVEVEVHLGAPDAAAVSPAVFVEGQHCAESAELRAVLRRRDRRTVDVRRRDVTAPGLRGRIAERFTKEGDREPAAVADRRLGDHDRDRQKAPAVEQPFRQVYVTVFRVPDPASRSSDLAGATHTANTIAMR
jgi:hypothetical protein